MVKKTVETEVDFPECTICGNGIFEGETFFDLDIWLSKMTVDNRGGSSGPRASNSGKSLRICKKCFLDEDMQSAVKLEILLELERQKKELESKYK